MLALTKITHRYGSQPELFSPLSLNMSDGDGILLLGENGVGKTTLLRIVAGLLHPSHGKVAWEKAPRLGVAMGQSYLYPDLTGRENLELYLKLYNIDHSHLGRVANAWCIGKFWNQSVHTLSRGQHQRLSLARATIHQPTVLILDEPQTALDAEGIGLLEAYLSDFKISGGMMWIASHEPELFRKMCTRELRIHRHEKVEGA